MVWSQYKQFGKRTWNGQIHWKKKMQCTHADPSWPKWTPQRREYQVTAVSANTRPRSMCPHSFRCTSREPAPCFGEIAGCSQGAGVGGIQKINQRTNKYNFSRWEYNEESELVMEQGGWRRFWGGDTPHCADNGRLGRSWPRDGLGHARSRQGLGAADAVSQDTRVCGDRVVDVSFGGKRPG